MSLDSARVVRQLQGSPIQAVIWQASVIGLEGTVGTLVVAADSAGACWLWTRASKGPWSCESNSVGIGPFPVSVPPDYARRDSTLFDVMGRRLPHAAWGVPRWGRKKLTTYH